MSRTVRPKGLLNTWDCFSKRLWNASQTRMPREQQKCGSANGCAELNSDSTHGNSFLRSGSDTRHGKFRKNKNAQSRSEIIIVVLLGRKTKKSDVSSFALSSSASVVVSYRIRDSF